MTPRDDRHAVIVDGGPAGLAAVWAASAGIPGGAGQPVVIACVPSPDGSGNRSTPARRKAVTSLARLAGASKVVELVLPAGMEHVRVNEPATDQNTRRVLSHLLLDACVEAMALDVSQIVWPVIPGAAGEGELRTETIADACDRSLLAGQLASLDAPRTGPGSRGVRVETPYADFTDRQLAELLIDLGAPLEGSSWCESGGERACSSCAACRRWAAAFQRAGARLMPVP